MQDASLSAELKREQDNAAAISDAAISDPSPLVDNEDGYPALKPGPEQTSAVLNSMVLRLAQALHSQRDSDPDKVEQLLGFSLPPDAQGKRRGLTGKVGIGIYELAVWKPSPKHPGHRVELVLSPIESCVLTYDALNKPLVAEGFKVFVPTFGDDQRITFHKIVAPSLGLYIEVTPDHRDAPHCVSVVSLEMERADA